MPGILNRIGPVWLSHAPTIVKCRCSHARGAHPDDGPCQAHRCGCSGWRPGPPQAKY